MPNGPVDNKQRAAMRSHFSTLDAEVVGFAVSVVVGVLRLAVGDEADAPVR